MSKHMLDSAESSLKMALTSKISDDVGACNTLHPDVFNQLLKGNTFKVVLKLLQHNERGWFDDQCYVTIQYLTGKILEDYGPHTPVCGHLGGNAILGSAPTLKDFHDSSDGPWLVLRRVAVATAKLAMEPTEACPVVLKRARRKMPFVPARVCVKYLPDLPSRGSYDEVQCGERTNAATRGGLRLHEEDLGGSIHQISPAHPRAILFGKSGEMLLLHISLVAWFSRHIGEELFEEKTPKALACFASLVAANLKTLSRWEASDFCVNFDFWNTCRDNTYGSSVQRGGGKPWPQFIKSFYVASLDFAAAVNACAGPNETLSSRAVLNAAGRRSLQQIPFLGQPRESSRAAALQALQNALLQCERTNIFPVCALLTATPPEKRQPQERYASRHSQGRSVLRFMVPTSLRRSSIMCVVSKISLCETCPCATCSSYHVSRPSKTCFSSAIHTQKNARVLERL